MCIQRVTLVSRGSAEFMDNSFPCTPSGSDAVFMCTFRFKILNTFYLKNKIADLICIELA